MRKIVLCDGYRGGCIMEKEKISQKTWFTVLFLIIFFPVGLFTMWKYKKFNKVARIIITAIFVISFVSAFFEPDDSTDSAGQSSKATTESQAKKVTSKKATTAKAKKSVPTEYSSALRKAETYGNSMYMSKQAIYDQLVSEHGEKFSKKAAQYAMKNLKIDWKKNALAKAKDYSDTMYMSKQGIYDQLKSQHGEKFTEKEAAYAIKQVKANWKENALKKAKDYQGQDMSKEAIRDQLISNYGEKFTQEEANYAVKHLK